MQLFLIIISLILALGVVLLLWQKSCKKQKLSGKLKAQIRQKEERKKKILALLEKKKKISNDDVRKHLKVAKRTATKYCNELEKDGKIRQIGKTGRSVFYKII